MEEVKEKTLEEKINDAYESFNSFKTQGDIKGTSYSLLSLLTLLESELDYKQIIDLTSENLDLVKESEYIIPIINKRITALLRVEEFNELLKTLEFKSSLSIESDTEKVNILFYKSIAFEALDEVSLAIESLESIVDNVPRYTLINKYLKLAILYLRNGNLNKAKDAYEYASLVDNNHKNDMFPLVESDLYYYSQKYQDALTSYETFFLNSHNKYKYLDRYILINIKLDRFDDAYKFYKEFKNKESLRLSTQNRYSFLKAAYELLLAMKKEDELSSLRYELESLKPIYFRKEEKEKNDLITSITKSISIPVNRFDKYKNIANKFFKLLNNIEKNILVFVEFSPDGYLYSKFNNTQLREKELTFSNLKDHDVLTEFYVKEDTVKEYYIDSNFEKINEKVKAYYIGNEYVKYGYFFVNYSEEYDIVYQVLRDALFEVFNKIDIYTKTMETENAFVSSLVSNDTGFIKITSERVELFDSYSRKLFNLKSSVITFDEFKLLSKENIFVDTFISNKNIVLPFNICDKEVLIEFKSSSSNNFIYSFIKDVSTTKRIEDKRNNYYIKSGLKFYNENMLRERIEELDTSYSIIGLSIPVIEEDDILSKRNDKLESTYNFLKQASPSSEVFYIGENHFILLSQSIDKRIIEAIYKNIEGSIKQLFKVSYSLRIKSISGFASKALKNKSYKEVEELIEYGYYYSTSKNKFIFLDKEEKKDYALFVSQESDIIRRINDEVFLIDYYPIINEDDNTIRYLLSNFKMPYDLSANLFEKVVSKNELETKVDTLLLKKVFKEANELNPKFRFIIPIHKESITNTNFVKKMALLFKEYGIIDRVVLLVDSFDFKEYKQGIKALSNSGMKLSINYNEINDLEDISLFSIIFMKCSESNEFIEYVINGIREKLNKEIIITEGIHIPGTLSYRSDYKVYDFETLKKY